MYKTTLKKLVSGPSKTTKYQFESEGPNFACKLSGKVQENNLQVTDGA